MSYGIIGFSSPGQPNQPSPSIWGDCSSQELLDEGTGFFKYETFEASVTLPSLPNAADAGGTFTYDAATDSVCVSTTAATISNGASFWTRPLGAIALGTGNKFWFEANVAFSSIADTKGVFVGLSVLAGLVKNIVATSTTLQANSLIGFFSHSDAPAKFDFVMRNAAGALITLIADVTNAASITANGGTPGNLVANTFVKLGLRYDGQQYVYVYVNGVQAGKVAVDATYDQTHDYGAIVGVTTGAAAAAVLKTDFLRVATKNF